MKNMKVSLIISSVVLTLGIFLSVCVQGQEFSHVDFVADNSNFPNPERGMYHHKEVRSAAYFQLSKSEMAGYRNDGITLIMRVFYLESFVDGDISAEYLENVRTDFAIARETGMKLLVRFAYTTKSSPPFRDATPERVLAHIAQLKPVLQENSDVIALVQAGFIGAWGEWFYTDHFSQVVGFINEQNWIDRKAVVDALLNALPEDRTIAIRTPAYKRKLTGTTAAITSGEAFLGTAKARLGHHNDCFLASSNDVGTYVNVAEEKNYIEQETYYLPLGGETCGVLVPLSECPNALAEVERLHWSYMNIDYHPQVIDGFTDGGCLPDIRRKLGYRYRLTQGDMQTKSSPGSGLEINIELLNDGWANVYNSRLVEIVLKNNATGKEYFFETDEDPRRWSLSGAVTIHKTIGLPDDMMEGTYSLFLNLPDPRTSLYGNPFYSIRLANDGVWNEQTGYNALGVSVSVDDVNNTPAYAGTDFMILRNQVDEDLAPSPLLSSASSNEVLLYWGIKSNDPYRVVERSDDGVTFTPVTTVPGDVLYYRDKNVVAGTDYTYRYHFRSGNVVSENTGANLASTSEVNPDFYTFIADGVPDEWNVVKPQATQYTANETFAVRLFADSEKLNVALEGSGYQGYAIFLDSDNNVATGISNAQWETNGFDFLIRNDSLYRAQAQVWVFVYKVSAAFDDGFREISVPLADLSNLQQNIVLNVAASLRFADATVISLPFGGKSPATYVRTLPAPIPSQFTVTSSETIPETRLVVEWNNVCINCDGFVLERSPDGATNFQEIFKTPSVDIYRDDGLTVNTSYYYRMYAFNETGKSQFTPVLEGTTQQLVTGIEENDSGVRIFPNPVEGLLVVKTENTVSNNLQLRLSDTMGKAVSNSRLDKDTSNPAEVIVNLTGLKSGVYILWIADGKNVYPFKILKI